MPKVLVVEDNKDVSFMVCEALRHHVGCEVITAGDGKECLEMVNAQSPDAILLDINMPGMDGFEVCKILKGDESTKRIPVIFLTATLIDLKDKIKGLEIGADDYLAQPIDNLELVTRVKVMLRIRQLIEKEKESESLYVTLHNLCAPLNSIIGFSELLESEGYGPLSPKQKEFIDLIHQSSITLRSEIMRFTRK